jgi:hypothetical protein
MEFSGVNVDKDNVLWTISNHIKSDMFLKQDDEGRLHYLEAMKKVHLGYADDINRTYIDTLMSLNPILVQQVREVFGLKQFQVGTDLERQLMIDKLMKAPSVSEGIYRFPREALELIAQQETIDKPTSIFNVMQAIREVLRSKMFDDFSPENKQRYVNLILEQPQVLQAGITSDDVVKAYLEIKANTEAIKLITADPLFLIMSRLDPKSVLRTCETTNQFARLCRNPNLFSALMRVHYPDSFVTSNPKEQYIAITMGLETTYRLGRDQSISVGGDQYWTTFERTPVQYEKTQLLVKVPGFKLKHLSQENIQLLLGEGYVPPRLRPFTGYTERMIVNYKHEKILPEIEKLSQDELIKLYEAGKLPDWLIEYSLPKDYMADHDTEIVFRIKGYPIHHGTTAWLLILQSHSAGIEDKVEVFKTKEDLATYFIEHEYPDFLAVVIEEYLDSFYEEGNFNADDVDVTPEGIAIIMSTKRWEDWIKSSTLLPYPFTPESVYEHILESDELKIREQSRRNWWLFREVIF